MSSTEPTATYYIKEVGALEPAVQVDQNGLVLGQWKSGICGCLDDLWPNACMSCFFPCVALAQVAHRVGFAAYGSALVCFGVVFTLHVVASWITSGLSWSYMYDSTWAIVEYSCLVVCAVCVMVVRTDVRKKLSIPGSHCEDFICGLCCNCCAIAQMATQTNSYEPTVCDFGPKDTLPAYASMA